MPTAAELNLGKGDIVRVAERLYNGEGVQVGLDFNKGPSAKVLKRNVSIYSSGHTLVKYLDSDPQDSIEVGEERAIHNQYVGFMLLKKARPRRKN